MADGTQINADIFRPESNEKFPAIFWGLGFSPYFISPQRPPVTPEAISTHDLMVKRSMKIVYQKENQYISEMFRGNENAETCTVKIAISVYRWQYRFNQQE